MALDPPPERYLVAPLRIRGIQDTMLYETLSGEVIGAAIEVHRLLGPGLLESAYRECLCWELRDRGHVIDRERAFPVAYKGARVDVGYRADLIVDARLLVELKSTDRIARVHTAQLLTYLKLSRLRLGILMNFNVPVLKDGILRVML